MERWTCAPCSYAARRPWRLTTAGTPPGQLLSQMKHHSSPSGDATQRLAHCFAQGLEARLAGPGSQVQHPADVFILFTRSGSYSTPYFVPRFREALFHYSTMFDMMDATTPRECPISIYMCKKFFEYMLMILISIPSKPLVELYYTLRQK